MTSLALDINSFPPTLCDLFLFQKVKSTLRGHHYESTEAIQGAVNAGLKQHPTRCIPGMPQTVAASLEKYLQVQEKYIEGDHIVVDEKVK
jgi:hypothetical protein